MDSEERSKLKRLISGCQSSQFFPIFNYADPNSEYGSVTPKLLNMGLKHCNIQELFKCLGASPEVIPKQVPVLK